MPAQADEILKSGRLGAELLRLCTAKETVSTLMANNPELTPGDAWHLMYSGYRQVVDEPSQGVSEQEDLRRAAQCGQWGATKPSDLFLQASTDLLLYFYFYPTSSMCFLPTDHQIYRDVLATIEESPDRAMVSLPLLGSSGVVPLTVISTIPDIARHMANVIVRAEKEVFLATNYWENSVASRYLTNALHELDRRAAERGNRVVVKVMYDRGSLKQLTEPHAIASVGEYTGKKVALPSPDSVPNLDLQVMNYHQPIMGTFHAKFMVVDRKMAVLQSNNIQDNNNLELMVHFEGPIVDSFYDMALLSWSKKLDPPLPTLDTPATGGAITAFAVKKKAHTGPHIHWHKPGAAAEHAGKHAGHAPQADAPAGQTTTENSHKREVSEDSSAFAVFDKPAEEEHTANKAAPSKDTSKDSKDSKVPAKDAGKDAAKDAAKVSSKDAGEDATKDTSKAPNKDAGKDTAKAASKDDVRNSTSGNRPAAEDALVERIPTANKPSGPDAETKTFLDRGKQHRPHVHKDPHLAQSTPENPQYDDDIASEVARVQNSMLPRPGETIMGPVNRLLNHTVGNLKAEAPVFGHADEMTPYVSHPIHEPFPIAMVNRPPFGLPTHSAVVQPQNAAFLSALRNARKSVFIQTPTLNAEPLLPAIQEACERGIDVICYVSLGYNDQGELLPRQGGTNDMVAHQLYTSLSPAARKHLHYFWYVAKDQTRPIPQVKKQRDCHIKLMIVDESIGIMGNGNQDTQSWYHSQEINVMLENSDVCRAWIDAVRRNQNTHIYGALNKETGLWRDSDGKEADGAIGPDPGRFSWARGLIGAVKRVQGKGGF